MSNLIEPTSWKHSGSQPMQHLHVKKINRTYVRSTKTSPVISQELYTNALYRFGLHSFMYRCSFNKNKKGKIVVYQSAATRGTSS